MPNTPEKWKDPSSDQLASSFPLLKTREEAYRYLEDLATIAEIKAMSQRLEVARLLLQRKTYPQIVEETGISTATISRIKKTVQYGVDGYGLVLYRLKNARKKW